MCNHIVFRRCNLRQNCSSEVWLYKMCSGGGGGRSGGLVRHLTFGRRCSHLCWGGVGGGGDGFMQIFLCRHVSSLGPSVG
jgi:hypothetical protein